MQTLKTTSELEGILAHRPQLLEKYQAFYTHLWRASLVDARLLELCRLRTAAIHQCEAELLVTNEKVGVSDAERAAVVSLEADGVKTRGKFNLVELAAFNVVDLMTANPHAIDDNQISLLENSLGANGCVAFLVTIAFFDVTCRLKNLWQVTPVETSHDFSLSSLV